MASNGLLEALVFARICAEGIEADVSDFPAECPLVEVVFEAGGQAPDAEAVAALRRTMTDLVGVVRSGEGLRQALKEIARLEAAYGASPSFLNMCATATLIAGCALMREESRGAHERLDFPETLPGAGKRSRVTLAEVSALRDEICKEVA